jgi:hypothetical protein
MHGIILEIKVCSKFLTDKHRLRPTSCKICKLDIAFIFGTRIISTCPVYTCICYFNSYATSTCYVSVMSFVIFIL